MARLEQIVVDCHHPARLAHFWAAVLDDFEVRAYDDAEVARLAALGLTPDTDPVVVLDGPHVEICFQKVDPPPVTKKPLHLDVATGDRASEIRRLVSLGASVMERFERHLDAGSRGQRLLRRRRVAQRVVRRGPLQPLAARQALCARGADVRWTP